MIEIRPKDRLFLLVAAPLALAAAYVFLWRGEAAARLEADGRTVRALVAPEDFDRTLAAAERARAEAEDGFARAQAEPVPAAAVAADAAESAAERERAVLAVFREAGLHVVSSRPSAESDARALDALKATGSRPGPLRRVYLVDGRYPDVVSALAVFSARKMAVVLESLSMSDAPLPRWKLEVWL